jgi:copper chaperone NosL
MKALCLVLMSAWFAGCASGPAAAVAIDSANDACHRCRMIASDPRLAAQIVAPGDEPLVFDDLGCLRDHVASAALPSDAVVYVADHRTGEWVLAGVAVYTRVDGLPTPMGSHLLAHADATSRDADPAARGGQPVHARELLGAAFGREVRR